MRLSGLGRERVDRLINDNTDFHLFVVSIDDWLGDDNVLRDHCDGLGGRLNKIRLELKIIVDDRLSGLDTKDIAADLVAKLDPASLKSEEGGVAALLLWSLELD